MAPTNNPFEVFGLTPEMVHHLKEKELFALVKSVYRCLHKFYHPDMAVSNGRPHNAKNASLAIDLNLAFEKLNLDKDAESFKYHHKLYASRRNKGLRKKINSLEGTLKEAESNHNLLARNFMSHLLRDLTWQQSDDESSNLEERSCRLDKLSNIALGLNDVAINHNIRGCSWDLGSNYKEILFDNDGRMFYRPVGRSKPFQVKYIHLLGTINVDKIDLLPLLRQRPPRPNFFKGPALDSRHGIDKPCIDVINTISLEKFKKFCLPRLCPELRERSYLFSIQRPVYEKEADISLEGVIVKVSRSQSA
jgi:hypothetical protein